MTPKRHDILERIMSKVEIIPDGCWEWKGYTDNHGYGRFDSEINARRVTRVHRAMWVMKFGSIPDNLNVCHKCDNPICVNPDHLFLGTIADNNRDMRAKNRGRSRKLTKQHIKEILDLYSSGKSIKDLSELFNIHRYSAYRIVKGIYWRSDKEPNV